MFSSFQIFELNAKFKIKVKIFKRLIKLSRNLGKTKQFFSTTLEKMILNIFEKINLMKNYSQHALKNKRV